MCKLLQSISFDLILSDLFVCLFVFVESFSKSGILIENMRLKAQAKNTHKDPYHTTPSRPAPDGHLNSTGWASELNKALTKQLQHPVCLCTLVSFIDEKYKLVNFHGSAACHITDPSIIMWDCALLLMALLRRTSFYGAAPLPGTGLIWEISTSGFSHHIDTLFD